MKTHVLKPAEDWAKLNPCSEITPYEHIQLIQAVRVEAFQHAAAIVKSHFFQEVAVKALEQLADEILHGHHQHSHVTLNEADSSDS